MRLRWLSLLALSVGAIVASAPSAYADLVRRPGHEKAFHSIDELSFMVGDKGERINRILPLNWMLTTHEALVSNTVYARIDGTGTGVLKVGYHVGCAIDVGGMSLGAAPDVIIPFKTQEMPDTNLHPGINAQVRPGRVVDVPLVEKNLTGEGTGYVVVRDAHLNVSSCIGPVSIRFYAKLTVKTDKVDDEGSIFGKPTWL